MSDVAIRIEGLGKQYRIGTAAKRHDTLREALTGALRAPLENLRQLRRLSRFDEEDSADSVWALRDLTFDVPRGEAMGIIGRNGAGKSTLLKVLSRITEPTRGRAEVSGRVGSLLEVGTGFHPELSGRENVYLNGSILGMNRAYIDRQFDQIVAFSGVEKYIDTPVKRYSSGMYLRLAFSVAAHLEPEILVVDEVLAVGDAEFQRKCLGKMEEVAGEGRTVLLVSHQMAAIQNLCRTAVWMDGGRLRAQGATDQIITEYLSYSTELSRIPMGERRDRVGTGEIRFRMVSLEGADGQPVSTLSSGADSVVVLHFDRAPGVRELRNLQVNVGLDNKQGSRIALLSTDLTGDLFSEVPAGCDQVRIRLDRLPLVPGRYGFTLYSTLNGVVADWIQNAGVFDVEAGDFFRTGKLPSDVQGDILLSHGFSLG
jgi:lipopolysaccharide transport system ATP-binding protein